jgi:hypothetical protein
MAETNTQLLEKVLEIVQVMGEVREQLNGFVQKCKDTDVGTAKSIDDLQKRMSVLELEGSKIVRELIKQEDEKVRCNAEALSIVVKDLEDLKIDLANVKAQRAIIGWKIGAVISIISIGATVGITYFINYVLPHLL